MASSPQPEQDRDEDSFSLRLTAKIGNGIFALPLNVALQFMLPRAIGPGGYGNYTFLSAFFTDAINLLDGGTSHAFFNKFSQRPREPGIATFYATFALALLVLLALLPVTAHLTVSFSTVWQGLPGSLVALGLMMAFGNWTIGLSTKALDAQALTRGGEATVLVAKAVLTLSTALLFFSNRLTLVSFFVLQIVLNTGLIYALARMLRRKGRVGPASSLWSQPLAERLAYLREFWLYSHPLYLATISAAGANLLDKWLLQRLGGAAQQGFLGLGLQIGSVIFVVGGATASLLGREFARSFGRGETEELRAKFQGPVTLGYNLTAFLGIFCATQAGFIVTLIGGSQFASAAAPTALMCLYPLHQFLGQTNMSLMYATDRTRLARNVGMGGVLAGIPLTFLFLGPHSWGGLQLGAIGLAAKLLLHQFAVVNVIIIMNARHLGLPVRSVLTQQVKGPAVFAAVVAVSMVLSSFIPGPFARFLVCGMTYTVLCAAVVRLRPSVLGLSRTQVDAAVARIRGPRRF
jgi:O-antigen/teichoic acid export membrane protein